MNIVCFLASDPRFALCVSLRFAVFVEEQKVPESEELDATDNHALHFLTLASDGHPIGTARLFPTETDSSVYRIGRMAVARDHRQRGIGRALMEAMMIHAEPFARRLVLDAQVQAIPFYQSCGFTVCGPEHLDCGIMHRLMERFCSGPWES